MISSTVPVSHGRLDCLSFNWPDDLKIASHGRRIWVWLPEGYEQRNDWPMLIMHDGQNVFRDADATFGTCWRMIEAQVATGVPMIVVGIEGQNEPLRRFNEFSPWVNSDMDRWKGFQVTTAGGMADRYLSVLIHQLLPQLRQRYACSERPEQTWLGGSSMGALLTLYTATRYQRVFGRYLAMSTATWFAHSELLSLLSAHEFLPATKIYADIGTCETSNAALSDFPAVYLDGNRAMFQVLQSKLGSDRFCSRIAQGAEHNEDAWSHRLPGALAWLRTAAPPKV